MLRYLVHQKSSQAGFTLVELMVVVAIIGVLAAIGIPQVNRFIAKSKQSEARVNLGTIYTLNKNFQSEFIGFTNCLSCMGYRPEGRLRYNTGWSQGVSATTLPPRWTDSGRTVPTAGPSDATVGNAPDTLTACPAINATTTISVCRTLLGATNAAPPGIPTTGVGVSAIATDFTTFTAVSISLLISGAQNDIWQIDHNKNLTNPQDGSVF